MRYRDLNGQSPARRAAHKEDLSFQQQHHFDNARGNGHHVFVAQRLVIFLSLPIFGIPKRSG
jgi:hypothetical protein